MTAPAGPWRLALPMYNVTPELGRAWEDLLRLVMDGLRRRGWTGPMQVVAAPSDPMALWRAPDLLLSQTCGYPLVTELGEAVRVLAVPAFALPGCEGVLYRSAIVVPRDGAATLQDLRGRTAAVNQAHSHSGMNALRHTIAPLARDGRFFARVLASGSHMASLAMLQRAQADVAAVDSATFGLAARYAPAAIAGLRVLQYTQAAPGLPLIGSTRLSDAQVADLRAVLQDLPRGGPSVLARLCIRRFEAIGLDDYRPVLVQEQQARALGYPVVA